LTALGMGWADWAYGVSVDECHNERARNFFAHIFSIP
jgi:hypothetical protein